MPDSTHLPIAGLETVYDALAQAIDEAGPGRSELMLVKLALLCADSLADVTLFRQHLQSALQDLPS